MAMLNVEEVNALERHEFTSLLAPVFEHSPWIAARTEAKRPFRDRAELLAALGETVMKASHEEKVCLVRAHPDLVGDAVLTNESQREQAEAGLGQLSAEEIKQFRQSNAAYKERFGFPFVICARLHKKDAILQAFPVRLRHSHEQELEIALAEILKIADLRLQDLVK
ncbi:MAG TPA: 2-oxo-4-hydroxy-4-carboxy-5-ureidoimidazoline decarboxylase [Chthoniobacterales bacterium]|jgi:OHCU decarboxylase